MVALRLAMYDDEIPQIGKICVLLEQDVTIEWWIGGYCKPWIEWRKRNKVVTETFHKNAILCGNIQLTKASRLRAETIEELKSLYSSKELI